MTDAYADFAEILNAAGGNMLLAGKPIQQNDKRVQDWQFWDTVFYPRNILSNQQYDYTAFSPQAATNNGFASNFSTPLTADFIYYNTDLAFWVDFNFTGSFTGDNPSPTNLDVQYMNRAAFLFLQSTIIEFKLSNTTIRTFPLGYFANYQLPAAIDGVQGQAAPAPYQVNPQSHQQHHGVALHYASRLLWAQQYAISLAFSTNFTQFWNGMLKGVSTSGAAEPINPAIPPFNISMQPIISVMTNGLRLNVTQ